MARTKEEKREFIASLRAGVELMKEQGIKPPSNLLESFSPNNALMILFQRPNATQCAGFHAWREAGRAVNKGARGIAILVPLGTRVDDDGEESLAFSWRYVFDISDTHERTASDPAKLRDLVSA